MGNRIDGRAWDELRAVDIRPGFIDYPEGSVLIEVGQTRVICNASIDATVPGWLIGQGRGWVTAEYALLPRSTHTRTPRETRGPGGRTHEIQRLIGRSLRAAVDLSQLGERQILVDCDVIQADGGTRTASITGGYVALALALKKLIADGLVSPWVFKAPVAAVSVGMVGGAPALDLCYEEDRRADVDLNVVMTGEGAFVEVQGTAEGPPFSRETLDELLALAGRGIERLVDFQNRILKVVMNGIHRQPGE